MITMANEKPYTVFDSETKKIVYSGQNAFKALQALHGHGGSNIQFSSKITAAIFDYIMLMSERLN